MNILFIGKRFNTNRDALLEKFGRNYQLPLHLAARHNVTLWLVDYHSKTTMRRADGPLNIISTPIKNLALIRHYALRKYETTNPIEIVIASGDCYIGLMAQRIAKKIKAKFIFDVYDKYDEFGGYIRSMGFRQLSNLMRTANIRLFANNSLLHTKGKQEQNPILNIKLNANNLIPID